MTATGVAVCGAGIAGVSTAYHLSVVHGIDDVVVLDPRPPLTLTSDKSTECYRNWWPNPSMVAFMNRSIDLLESFAGRSEGAFHLNQRGYLYVHGPDRTPDPVGAEAVSKTELANDYPYLTSDAASAIRVRRAGWFSAQQLGAWMLDEAKEHGVTVHRDAVVGVDQDDDRVTGVRLSSGERIATDIFVNAAGPMISEVGAMTGATLPVNNEVHLKVAFRDPLGVIPRDAPMLIWADPQRLDLTNEERALCVSEGRSDLLEELPAGCHCRPEGGPESEWVLGLWEYHRDVRDPQWPLPVDPLYVQTVLRGLTTMIPGLAQYQTRPPEASVDGGYYTKTSDNLPLIGPSGGAGAYVCGGLSGYGVMAACAAGELAGRHVTGDDLPDYAAAFDPSRYDDPAYAASVTGADGGQI